MGTLDRCVRCPPGASIQGNKYVRCGNATFQPELNSHQVCQFCPPGEMPNHNHSACVHHNCPAGMSFGEKRCEICDCFSYVSTEFPSVSKQCPSGMISHLDGREPSPGGGIPGVKCVHCPAGTEIEFDINQGGYRCLPCKRRTMNNDKGEDVCILDPREEVACRIGFRLEKKKNKCIQCKVTEYRLGNAEVTSCKKCPAGMTSDIYVRVTVQSGDRHTCYCPSGTIFFNTACKTCPAGTFATLPNDHEPRCRKCDPKSWSEAGSTSCFPCSPRRPSFKFNGRKCKVIPECPKGQVLPYINDDRFDNRCRSVGTGCPVGEKLITLPDDSRSLDERKVCVNAKTGKMELSRG